MVIVVNITIKSSYADQKISLIKISGKVEISADSKTWTVVKNTQKINNRTWLKTGKDGSVVLVLPDKTQTKSLEILLYF